MKNFFRKPINIFNKFKLNDLYALVPALILYLSLTLRNISGSSIWFDEGFGVYLSRFDFFEIAKYTAADVHPPLYYWILKIWTIFFGATEFSVRSLSVVFGSIAIILIYFIVKDLFSRKSAVLAVLLTSIAPMLIRYGEEARMYTLVLCVSLLGTWFFMKALKYHDKKYWTFYAVTVGIGLWVHYFVALVWIVHWLFLIFDEFSNFTNFRKIKNNILSKKILRPYIVSLVVFLPWLPFMLFQLGVIQGGGFWIGQVGSYSFTNYITTTFYYADHAQVLSWLAALLFLLVFAFYLFSKSSYSKFSSNIKSSYKLFLGLAFLSPVILFALSLPPLRSAFVERYLLSASIFVTIVLAILIAESKVKRKYKIITLGLIIFISAVGINNVYYYGNYNKNSNTEILSRQMYYEVLSRAQKGEPVITSSPWIYYETFIYSLDKNPVYFADQYTAYEYGSLHMLRDTKDNKIKNIQEFIKNNKRFWYIGTADGLLEAPYDNICTVDRFVIEDKIDKKMKNQGVLYKYCEY